MPPHARAGSHILRAFNIELSRIVSRHSIPTIRSSQTLTGSSAKIDALRADGLLSEAHEPTEAETNQARLGLIKLHWWRDGLEAALEQLDRLQSDAPSTGEEAIAAHSQPVLNMLAIACRQYGLTAKWIESIIQAKVNMRARAEMHHVVDTDDRC